MNSRGFAYSQSGFWRGQFTQQAPRRALVVAWALCCIAFLVLAAIELTGPIWFVLIAATLAVNVLLFLATHRVADLPTSALDERQRAVRDRSFRVAYRVVAGLILVTIGGGIILFTSGVGAPTWLSYPGQHSAVVMGLGLACLQLVSLLPTALIAWTERDEPAEID
jgi:hypothetical protein